MTLQFKSKSIFWSSRTISISYNTIFELLKCIFRTGYRWKFLVNNKILLSFRLGDKTMQQYSLCSCCVVVCTTCAWCGGRWAAPRSARPAAACACWRPRAPPPCTTQTSCMERSQTRATMRTTVCALVLFLY